MVKSVAIVTDSMSCLTKNLIETYGITIVPVMLLVGNNVYRDLIDISPSDAYEMFLCDPESFRTSPATPGDYLEAFRIAAKSAESILCVTLSSRLSTGFEMANVACEQAREEIPGKRVVVFDSLNAVAAEGFVVLAAARAAEEGADLDHVIQTAEKIKDRVTFVILLDTIKHIYRTGRIPKIASKIGSALNLKPILTSSGGLIKFKGIARNHELGIEKILRLLRDKVGDKPIHVAVMHAYASKEAMMLEGLMRKGFNCTELWVTEFSPVLGYAFGTRTLGFAYYTD